MNYIYTLNYLYILLAKYMLHLMSACNFFLNFLDNNMFERVDTCLKNVQREGAN